MQVGGGGRRAESPKTRKPVIKELIAKDKLWIGDEMARLTKNGEKGLRC